MKRFLAVFFILAFLLAGVNPVSADEPVVRAILFYSPSCGHCHKVIREDFPPLYEAYGGVENVKTWTSIPATDDEIRQEEAYGPAVVWIRGIQLEIAYVNVAWPIGQDLYNQAGEIYDVPDGVPRLVVGDTALVGSVDIPGQFPGIIEQGLQNGGIDWPSLDGLEAALAELQPLEPEDQPAGEDTQPSEEPAETATTEGAAQPAQDPTDAPESDSGFDSSIDSTFRPFDASGLTVMERIQRDLAGNLLAIAVLIGMVALVVYIAFNLKGKSRRAEASWKKWSIPFLSIIGLGVAGYLAFIETTGSVAVCGPIGDCNTVNHSEYAMLFGFLPVAVLGLLGYIGILAAWAVYMVGKGPLADAARVAIFLMAAFGTLFSIYLTYLEPFVIAATCIWCLTSAVLISAILWIALEPAKASWARLRQR